MAWRRWVLPRPTAAWTYSGLKRGCALLPASDTWRAAAWASRFELPTRKVAKVSRGSRGEPGDPSLRGAPATVVAVIGRAPTAGRALAMVAAMAPGSGLRAPLIGRVTAER